MNDADEKKLKHLNERGSGGFDVASPGTLNGLRSRAFFVQEFFFFLLWNWSSYMFVTYRKVKSLLQRRKAFRRFILCILLKLQTKLKWWSNPVPTCPHAHSTVSIQNPEAFPWVRLRHGCFHYWMQKTHSRWVSNSVQERVFFFLFLFTYECATVSKVFDITDSK